MTAYRSGPGARDVRRENGPGARDVRRESGPGARDVRRESGPGTRDVRREPAVEPYGSEVEVIPAEEAAREGRRQLTGITGRDPSGVVSVQPTEEGWLVGIELVEDHRIPASTDLLGLYEVELDADGELLAFRRVRRYQRGKGEVG